MLSVRANWIVLTLFGLAAGGIVWFLATDASVYLTYTPEKYTNYYWSRRGGLALHVGAGALALSVGLAQVALGLSGRHIAHRAWMLRSYLVTFGFVTLRVISEIVAAFGWMSEEDANSPAAWACWVVPLVILEIVYRRTRWNAPEAVASATLSVE